MRVETNNNHQTIDFSPRPRLFLQTVAHTDTAGSSFLAVHSGLVAWHQEDMQCAAC